jgi:hypothetical protein
MVGTPGTTRTCKYCGWDLTWQGIWDNGGVPYCCRTAEQGVMSA